MIPLQLLTDFRTESGNDFPVMYIYSALNFRRLDCWRSLRDDKKAVNRNSVLRLQI